MDFFSPFLRKILIVLFACVFLSVSTFTEDAIADSTASNVRKPYIRYDAKSEDGKRNLASLKKALSIMKDKKCTDPLSWYYQGAIHWVPTKGNELSGIAAKNELCPEYSNFKFDEKTLNGRYPGSDKLRASWDNCTHANNQAAQSSGIHFLPWHRLYLDHFEKIVRELSDDRNFSLPYWDYISLDDDEIPKTKPLIERLTMPEEFQHSRDDSKSDNSNSLYESGRDFNLNHGKPIDIDPHFSKIFRRQLENDFQNIKDAQTFKDFSSLLEKGIHGKMHTYIGGGFAEYYKNKSYLPIPFNKIFNRYFQENEIPQYGLMASVESAGFDPIFWLHHANIDRLWAQWTKKKNIHVSQQELEQVSWPYQFFETSGEAKGYTMQEVHHAVYNTDYNYDDISIPNYSDNDKSETKASSPPKTTLGENKTTTTIGRDKNLNLTIEVNNLYRELLKSLQPNNGEKYTSPRLKLDVNVTYTGKPRGLYEIYLNLPKDQSEKNEIMKDENTLIDTYLVGGMTFFVLDSEIPKSKKFTFSISDILYKQINNFSQFNPHSVSIEINQDKTRVNDRLTVDSIVIYAQN